MKTSFNPLFHFYVEKSIHHQTTTTTTLRLQTAESHALQALSSPPRRQQRLISSFWENIFIPKAKIPSTCVVEKQMFIQRGVYSTDVMTTFIAIVLLLIESE